MYPTTFGKFVDPITVSSHFLLREGDKVADFGAGSGHYMKSLSELVGNGGAVYLCEIQKNLVEALGIKARELRLTNVHPMWSDFEALGGVKLQDGTLDAVLLSNTLFQIEGKEVALREIGRVLRKGGRLLIIDWTDSFQGLGPTPTHVVIEEEAKRLAGESGFVFDRSFPAGDHHYGLAFRKE